MLTSTVNTRINIIEIISLFLFTLVFVSIISSSSFLYDYYFTLDGIIFEIIGKGWSEGKLPYVDLWDQKGPFIYFINACGYWMTGNKYGLFLIQIFFFFLSFTLLLHFYNQCFNKTVSWFLLVITSFHLAQLAPGGNVIEVYELPLHITAFILLWKWANNARCKVVTHPCRNALLYGVILAICLLNRLTDAIGVCLGAFCVFIYLIKHKQWQNIKHNIIAYISGFLIGIIPFFIYFYIKDGLNEMIYASILFNFDYKKHSFNEPSTLYSIISNGLAYISTYGLILISVVLSMIDVKNKYFHLMWTIIAIITCCYFLSTFMYEHYSIIAIPYFVIMVFEYYHLLIKLKTLKRIQFAVKTVGLTIAFVIIINGLYQLNQSLENVTKDRSVLLEFYDPRVLEFIGKDKENLLCYNIHPCIYLYNNITPCCRFFALQTWYSIFSDTVCPKINTSIENSDAKFIMIRKAKSKTLIEDILRIKYEEVPLKELSSQYILYKKK